MSQEHYAAALQAYTSTKGNHVDSVCAAVDAALAVLGVTVDEVLAERVAKIFCSDREPTPACIDDMLAALRACLPESFVVDNSERIESLKAENASLRALLTTKREAAQREIARIMSNLVDTAKERDGLLRRRDAAIARAEKAEAELSLLRSLVAEMEEERDFRERDRAASESALMAKLNKERCPECHMPSGCKMQCSRRAQAPAVAGEGPREQDVRKAIDAAEKYCGADYSFAFCVARSVLFGGVLPAKRAAGPRLTPEREAWLRAKPAHYHVHELWPELDALRAELAKRAAGPAVTREELAHVLSMQMYGPNTAENNAERWLFVADAAAAKLGVTLARAPAAPEPSRATRREDADVAPEPQKYNRAAALTGVPCGPNNVLNNRIAAICEAIVDTKMGRHADVPQEARDGSDS